MALTMDQIIHKTSYARLEKANTTVKLNTLKLGISKTTKLPLAAANVFSIDTINGKRSVNKYVTSVLFSKSKYVKLSCSCPDFMYRFEWALWQKGAADIVYSNGEAPDITNPAYTGGTCKHTVHLWEHMRGLNLLDPAHKYANKVWGAKPNRSKEIYKNMPAAPAKKRPAAKPLPKGKK